MSEARDILVKVKDLLSDPEHWCKGWYARTATGVPTTPNAPDAASWCLTGAIRKVEQKGHVALQQQVNRAFRLEDYPMNLPDLNDEHTHEEVLAEIDKAIERLS